MIQNWLCDCELPERDNCVCMNCRGAIFGASSSIPHWLVQNFLTSDLTEQQVILRANYLEHYQLSLDGNLSGQDRNSFKQQAQRYNEEFGKSFLHSGSTGARIEL